MRPTPAEQFFLWIVKIGLWIIPFLPLYVSSSMLFPFITGKNFAFRIIVEIIFALWVGLAAFRSEYRPRLTPLFKVVTVFIAIVFLADLFGPNPYRSFFSNYERMEGFMMVFHLYLYFVMLISVFRMKDWIVFFHVTLVASLLASGIGYLQRYCFDAAHIERCKNIADAFSNDWMFRSIPIISRQGGFRVDSTIGNPTYFAAYLLFHLWLLSLLMYRYWKKRGLVALYAGILLFESAVFYFTASRGPILALVIILVPFLASIVWFWPRIRDEIRVPPRTQNVPAAGGGGLGPYAGWSRGRKFALACLLASILIPAFLWGIRTADFVRNNQILSRLTNYSLRETTVQSRFLIWKMSARAAFERPILGWGQENYYLVFQKYFDPGLFAQEPWFDRSHNIIFDWLIHAGFPGIVSYLGVIAVACWVIVRGIRRGSFPVWYGIVLVSLFLTYLFQNLFVFDNLNTYLLFFAFLAFTEFFTHVSAAAPAANARPREERSRAGRGIAAGIVMLFVVVGVLYPLHIKPIKESRALIRALNLPSKEGVTLAQVESAFREALAYGSFGDTEVREQLSNMARGVISSQSIPADARNAFLAFTVDELKKETARPAKDVKHLLFLGTLLAQTASTDPTHASEAERTLQEAIRLSPAKQIIYFQLAQFYLSAGRGDDAIRVLKTAWELDKNYHEAGANLLMLAVISGKKDIADEVKHKLIITALNSEVLDRLGRVYRQVGDFSSAFPVYERLFAMRPENVEYRFVYAALLANQGRFEEARTVVEAVKTIDPSRAAEVDQFLNTLKQFEK